MLDQPVPNPLAKNPNVHTHKVFATVGLILIGTIIAIAGIWWYFNSQSGTVTEETTTKISTSSAQKSTVSAKPAETTSSSEYKNKSVTFKYPKGWYTSDNGEGGPNSFGHVVSIANYQFDEGDWFPPSKYRDRDDYLLLTYSNYGSTEVGETEKIVSPMTVGETKQADYLGAPATYKREKDVLVGENTAKKFTVTRSVTVDDNNTSRTGYFIVVEIKEPNPTTTFPYTYHNFSIQYYLVQDEQKTRDILNNTVNSFKFL